MRFGNQFQITETIKRAAATALDSCETARGMECRLQPPLKTARARSSHGLDIDNQRALFRGAAARGRRALQFAFDRGDARVGDRRDAVGADHACRMERRVATGQMGGEKYSRASSRCLRVKHEPRPNE